MLFDTSQSANVFGMPLGVDFPKALVDGLLAAYASKPPEELAKVHLILNTGRMERRVKELFDEGNALLLPRISLIAQVDAFTAAGAFEQPVPRIQRELEIAPLIHRLIDNDESIAPRSAVYDLANSLVGLMAEMHEEGVSPEAIAKLDVSDQSGHWARAQEFFNIAQGYFDDTAENFDAAARQRKVVQSIIQNWAETPPDHPIIIAGSTGSRGLTQLLMQCVARLPQGAVVLPGFDYDFADGPWPTLEEGALSEDHPQYRFHAFLEALEIAPSAVPVWPGVTRETSARDRLISLALRPAPVTDQWITEGPELAPIVAEATAGITLLEAVNTREEAVSIALRLRRAVEDKQRAALITPDRTLARQVSAALSRWDIVPDDSAGEPLHLTPLGRLTRHALELMQTQVSAELLITLLKHPLCHMGEGRGQHLLNTGSIELLIRRKGIPHPDAETFQDWAEKADESGKSAWANWASGAFFDKRISGELPLESLITQHLSLIEAIATDSAKLWAHNGGAESQKLFAELLACAPSSSAMSVQDYANLIESLMSSQEVRRADTPHSGVLIWGTLEARVQGVSLLILAGLNEGSWPETLPPDPWLNRQMRLQAGLLLPERKTGLSAHDFQQASSAPEVWLTRSQKSDDAETVPSRWVIRLTNLLAGLPNEVGEAALKDMRQRGADWLTRARLIDAWAGDQTPAKRPAPCPPVSARPRQLSITEIQRLTRDPYAIYAKHVLKLRPLGPLQKLPDALLRGNVLHSVMEAFVERAEAEPDLRNRNTLMQIARDVAEEQVPWPAARLMWLARFEAIVEGFLANEEKRLNGVTHSVLEREARFDLGSPAFTLVGKADRLDVRDDGTVAIYDYKTGTSPTESVRKHFDQQLPLTSLLAESGAFKDMGPLHTERAAYIGLGSKPGETIVMPEELDSGDVLARLRGLIAAYLEPDKGFASRRAVQSLSYGGDYDHLARYGEWSDTDTAEPEVLT